MHNYLLDTHTILWFFFESNKLSKKVKEVTQNAENKLWISAVSFWEISIKHQSGKLHLGEFNPTEFLAVIKDFNINVLPLSASTTASFYKLKVQYHKDPFDRMLIWQALEKDYYFITKDKNIALYKTEGLKTFW